MHGALGIQSWLRLFGRVGPRRVWVPNHYTRNSGVNCSGPEHFMLADDQAMKVLCLSDPLQREASANSVARDGASCTTGFSDDGQSRASVHSQSRTSEVTFDHSVPSVGCLDLANGNPSFTFNPGGAQAVNNFSSGVPGSEQRNSSVPPGVNTAHGLGALFKCTICNALVYESLLDSHLLVCPDGVKRGSSTCSPSPTSPPVGEASHAQHRGYTNPAVQRSASAPKDTHAKPCTPRDADRQAAVSPTTRNSWYYRHQKIKEEMETKEMGECTFQPRILGRGAPRTRSRSPDTYQSRWTDRFEQIERMRRLEQIEAQAYAQNTGRPKITHFAQAWSEKKHEADSSSGPVPSVFERLYQGRSSPGQGAQESAAADVGQKKSKVNAHRTTVALDFDAVCPEGNSQGSTGAWRHPPRQVPTTELLYHDALERKRRADEIAARAQDPTVERCPVLGRSRRYYWQMLERQVKASFNYASSNEPLLKRYQLEDFLVDFGCLPPQQKATIFEDERYRLSTAMWRHLDPQHLGQVDLLTMTVFFHVFMGAVDDASRASQLLCQEESPLPAMEEQSPTCLSHDNSRTPQSACERHPGLPGPNADAGAGAARPANVVAEVSPNNGASISAMRPIAPIPEEEVEDVTPSVEGDKIGREPKHEDDFSQQRIMELLARFDPFKLRTEFQTLYLHRMHFQAMRPRSAKSAENGFCSPEIDAKSRTLAERLIEQQRADAGGTLSSHADLMLWRHSKVQEKKQEQRVKAKDAEVNDCTFRPEVTPRVSDVYAGRTPRGMTRNDMLYGRAKASKERKQALLQEGNLARQFAEVEGCTFKPDTTRSCRTYNRLNTAGTSCPRGFYQNSQRIRAGIEAEERKRWLREDRLAKPYPLPVPWPSGGLSPRTSPAGVLENVTTRHESSLGFGEPIVSSPLCPVPENQGHRCSHRLSETGSLPMNECPWCLVSSEARRPSSASPSRLRSQCVHSTSPPPRMSASSSLTRSGRFVAHDAEACPDISNGQSMSSCLGCVKGDGKTGPLLLFVEVAVTAGQPPERVALHLGDSVAEVAAEFASKHMLTPALAQRLHTLLQEAMQQQEKLLIQQQQERQQQLLMHSLTEHAQHMRHERKL